MQSFRYLGLILLQYTLGADIAFVSVFTPVSPTALWPQFSSQVKNDISNYLEKCIRNYQFAGASTKLCRSSFRGLQDHRRSSCPSFGTASEQRAPDLAVIDSKPLKTQTNVYASEAAAWSNALPL